MKRINNRKKEATHNIHKIRHKKLKKINLCVTGVERYLYERNRPKKKEKKKLNISSKSTLKILGPNYKNKDFKRDYLSFTKAVFH